MSDYALIPSPEVSSTSSGCLLTGAKIFTFISGSIIAFAGSGFSLIYAITLFLAPAALDPTDTAMFLGLLVMSLGFGIVLMWHAGRALLNIDSGVLYFLPAWILVIVFIVIIGIGQALISFDLWPSLSLPLFHIIAATMPSLIILAFVARRLGAAKVRWRDLIINLSSGAFLAPVIAIVAEMGLGLILFVTLVVGMSLTPAGRAQVEIWLTRLQNPVWLENPENVFSLMTFLPVPITLVAIFAIIAPLVEELVKPLSITLLSYRRPTIAQLWLWGLAAGAGFALFENMFNTLLSIEAWGGIMLVRLGATAMHCLGSGLLALGWHRLLESGRPWRLFGAYGLSVLIHALWNGTVIILTALAFMGAIPEIVIGIIVIFLGGFLLLISISLFVAIIWITRNQQKALKVPG